MAKPFIKWVGGKTQLLDQFQALYPAKWGCYFEPFLGGGAVFFDVWERGEKKTGLLSDRNARLVGAYRAIAEDPGAVFEHLNHLQEKAGDKPKEAYYEARVRFNGLVEGPELAALFVYLNKNGFNGLYRENRSGQFNVPWGHRKKLPALPGREELSQVSEILSHFEIRNWGYEEVLASLPGEGDFVYLDPPYVPLSKTADFTSYTKEGFSYADQERLAEFFGSLSDRGVHVMLSNHDTPEVRDLYREFDCNFTTVKARRSVNSKGGKRGPVDEIVIRNYER